MATEFKLSYISYDFKFKKRLAKEDLYDVALLRNKPKKAKRKVLFLIDHVPTEDLRKRRICSGSTGDLLFKMFEVAHSKFKSERAQDVDFLIANFNCCKTYGKADDFREMAEADFWKRIRKIITEYKPDVIQVFGQHLLKFFCPDKVAWAHNNAHNFLGTTIDCKVSYKKDSHEFVLVPNISLNQIVGGKNNLASVANIMGYVIRNTRVALDGEMPYRISHDPKYKAVIVNTIKEFDSMMKELRKAKYVSIDSEAESLNKKVNRILTLQFCTRADVAYVLPIYHKDTCFSGKDLKYISKKLKEFFEYDNKNKCHIYTNAKFDLNIIRSNFDVLYFKNDVWDIQAGEFGYDENMKILQMFIQGRGGYYGLGNLAMQFGCGAYYYNTFGKEQRHTIKDADLDDALIKYCCLDVVVPYEIFLQQLKRAKDEGYNDYYALVGNQISDQIHTFSVLESTGALADVNYLFKLKHPDSVINQLVDACEKEIYTSQSVKKANEILAKEEQIPDRGLFGAVDVTRFSLNTSEHKQILFFDVLKLKPLSESKKKRPNGKFEGKIDKDFQDKYSDHPIVAKYTEWQKACKLRNAFVNSLIKLWGDSADFQSDCRIRPSYSYLKVVTGRTSASDPYRLGLHGGNIMSKAI